MLSFSQSSLALGHLYDYRTGINSHFIQWYDMIVYMARSLLAVFPFGEGCFWMEESFVDSTCSGQCTLSSTLSSALSGITYTFHLVEVCRMLVDLVYVHSISVQVMLTFSLQVLLTTLYLS